jgi:2-oxoglutarate ferredoxin oxidoreductase subunit beta
MRLRKLDVNHNPLDRLGAMNHMHELAERGEIATGLLYVDPHATDMHAALQTAQVPLNRLDESSLCPGSAALARFNDSLR